MCQAVWECGDPGVQFSDTIEEENMISRPINASNPCSEFLFMDESACNLASINLDKFRGRNAEFLMTVDLLIRAMDAIVDISGYPTEKIAENSRVYRPLGLGLTNVATFLMNEGVRYGSEAAAVKLDAIGVEMFDAALNASAKLARVHGAYPGWDDRCKSVIKHKLAGKIPLSVERYGLRNAQLTLMAPTGTISFMMGCESTGIEPVFAAEQTKTLAGGGTLTIAPECVLDALPSNVVTAIGSTAATIDEHLNMMSALQPYLSGGISKTVNLPNSATPADIREVYVKAWRLGLKSIAVYRDGSKGTQPLTDGKALTKDNLDKAIRKMEEENWEQRREDLMSPGWPGRRKLPVERQAILHKFSVNGLDGYVTVGLYEDGMPGEVFVKIAKEGSTASGFMDAWATSLSIAIQYGVPVRKLLAKGKGMSFEPAGFTLNKQIPTCTSLVDYICRWIEGRFYATGTEDPGDAEGPVGGDPEDYTDFSEWYGRTCPDCGVPVQTTGTCSTCPDCGWNGGCG